MTHNIDDRTEREEYDREKNKPLSKDQKECFDLLKKIVSDIAFWHAQGQNPWSLSSSTKTPTHVKQLQKSNIPPNTVGDFEATLKPIWDRERSEDGKRSDPTKELYAAIDMMRPGKKPSWDDIKKRLQAVCDLTENREVKKAPRPGSDDKGL